MSHTTRAQQRAATLQEQEMHSYYQPWLAAHGTSINVASNLESIAVEDLKEHGYRPRISRDRALMAFAQLATLRLNVRRAMVSLIDSKHQYILTEATKTVSLMCDKRHDSDDELWLGNAVVARDEAVCHHTFTNTYQAKEDNGTSYEARGLVVDDCRLDDRFKDRSYVQAEPGIRFYAGVPIVTRSGHAIGVYAVSDESPRDGLTAAELTFMQDIAAACLEHLEWAKDRVDRFKGERIVRGLASFIDCSSPRESHNVQQLQHIDRNGLEYSYEEDEASLPEPQDEDEGHRVSTMSEIESDAESVTSALSDQPDTSPRKQNHERPTEDSDDVNLILGRAGRILRKSTLADGVIFFGLDAGSTGPATLAPDYEPQEAESAGNPRKSSALLCPILGSSFSSRQDKQFAMRNPLSVETLQMYWKAYPEGKTLNFSSQGHGTDSGDDSSGDSHGSQQSGVSGHESHPGKVHISDRKRKTRVSHAEVLEKIPGVRTMIFIPLVDPVTSKGIAGGFVFTTTANRMMSLESNISYLKAFGASISAEVSRAAVEKLDRAKTTFIASMSHELRSPLHGILGSVEFLQDTTTDSYQAGLITSISNCSKTLLDTLSNLLSYAKVTTVETASATDDVELGELTESVVEAVCAGHQFKRLHTASLAADSEASMAQHMYNAAKDASGKLYNDDLDDKPSDPADTLTVLCDISPSLSWNVRTNPGALRRIIMNLVGNSLKYTSAGFVAVSLRAKEKDNMMDVILKVVDSGKGISEDFQRNHLFAAFQQQDTFASGTGLGLSIVKQLVDSLGGEINVQSKEGQGTQVEVKLQLRLAKAGIDLPREEIRATASRTKGLRLCCLDPNEEKKQDGRGQIARLDMTLSETCSTWFGMEVTTADNMKRAETDIFLYTEPPSLEYLLEHHSGETGGRITPLIIVCMNATEAISISRRQMQKLAELGRIVEVVPQPCGPMKMAKVLASCLDRVEKAEKDNETEHQKGHSLAYRGERRQELGADQDQVPQDGHTQVTPRALSNPNDHDLVKSFKTKAIPPSHAVRFPSSDALGVDRPPLMVPRSLSENTVKKVEGMEPLSKPPTSNGKSLHVLLVDDNKINVDLLVKFVQKFRLAYDTAYNGQEAVDKYRQAADDDNRFDVCLMDIQMPVKNGIEATREIRSFERERGLQPSKMLALSAFASTDSQAEAKESGIDRFLPKPVKFAELKKLLLDG